MSDHEFHRLLAAEKDAFDRYMRLKTNFWRTSDVVECARLIWNEDLAALLEYQDRLGGRGRGEG